MFSPVAGTSAHNTPRYDEAQYNLDARPAIHPLTIDVAEVSPSARAAGQPLHSSSCIDTLTAQSNGYWNSSGDATWRSRRHVCFALTAGVYLAGLTGIVVGCITGAEYGHHGANPTLGLALGFGVPVALSIAAVGTAAVLDGCEWRREVARRHKALGIDDSPAKPPLLASLREAVRAQWQQKGDLHNGA